MQSRNRDKEVEERRVDMVGLGVSWEIGLDTYTPPWVKPITSGSSNWVLCDDLESENKVGGGMEIQERRDICIPMADSC